MMSLSSPPFFLKSSTTDCTKLSSSPLFSPYSSPSPLLPWTSPSLSPAALLRWTTAINTARTHKRARTHTHTHTHTSTQDAFLVFARTPENHSSLSLAVALPPSHTQNVHLCLSLSMLWNASTRFGMPGLIHHREPGLGCVMSPPLQHIAAFVCLYKCRSVCMRPFLGIRGVRLCSVECVRAHVAMCIPHVFTWYHKLSNIWPIYNCFWPSFTRSCDQMIWIHLARHQVMYLCLNRSGLDHWGFSSDPDGKDLSFFSQLDSSRGSWKRSATVDLIGWSQSVMVHPITCLFPNSFHGMLCETNRQFSIAVERETKTFVEGCLNPQEITFCTLLI